MTKNKEKRWESKRRYSRLVHPRGPIMRGCKREEDKSGCRSAPFFIVCHDMAPAKAAMLAVCRRRRRRAGKTKKRIKRIVEHKNKNREFHMCLCVSKVKGCEGLCDVLTRADGDRSWGEGYKELVFFLPRLFTSGRIPWLTNVLTRVHGEGNDAEREKEKEEKKRKEKKKKM